MVQIPAQLSDMFKTLVGELDTFSQGQSPDPRCARDQIGQTGICEIRTVGQIDRSELSQLIRSRHQHPRCCGRFGIVILRGGMDGVPSSCKFTISIVHVCQKW